MKEDDVDIDHQDIGDATKSLGGPMTRARARRVDDALNQFMTKSLEGLEQVQGNDPKFIFLIQIHDQDVTYGLAAPFQCFYLNYDVIKV